MVNHVQARQVVTGSIAALLGSVVGRYFRASPRVSLAIGAGSFFPGYWAGAASPSIKPERVHPLEEVDKIPTDPTITFATDDGQELFTTDDHSQRVGQLRSKVWDAHNAMGANRDLILLKLGDRVLKDAESLNRIGLTEETTITVVFNLPQLVFKDADDKVWYRTNDRTQQIGRVRTAIWQKPNAPELNRITLLHNKKSLEDTDLLSSLPADATIVNVVFMTEGS